ncbi:hypothetical protein OCU04_001456 [Sclerotinia nivalis]|uniref:Uncharacterized protein n=1 Tax=Sclerotinia nivalis TaxID=352851 RepID=A0A9X0DQN9_9HELO|nr:hypothetical protein OCU04_001456 [Sclerotinia nivalis]
MSEILSNDTDIIRPQTPEDRSIYTGSGNPSESIALFDVGDSAWLSIPRKGNFEFIITERKQEKGKFMYQVKDPKSGVLYEEGEWFKQERLSSA